MTYNFRIVKDDSSNLESYTYRNDTNPDEKYIQIIVNGTFWLRSLVTFQPANIPDAPVMVVNTSGNRSVLLPRSVDDWEIKYYSSGKMLHMPEQKYLKNAGVVDLKKKFKKISGWGLYMELGMGQYICGSFPFFIPRWSIPSVSK